MKKLFIILSLILCVILSACGSAPAEPQIPEATPKPTPEPTPEPVITINGEDIPASVLDAGYTFDLFGQQVNTLSTKELSYKQVEIGDAGLETFRAVLPYMRSLETLSFDRCGTTDPAVDKLRNDFPDIKISWRIFFGPFSCMTDTKKIWASCDLTDETCGPLKYCHDVKYLDIGHNAMTDLSFLYDMPNLEVLIISCGNFSDITPVGSCKNLEYLELAETYVSDVSPIANCENLEHLNIGNNINITDISPLLGLKHLKRFCAADIYNNAYDWKEYEEEVKKIMPDTEVDFDWWGECLNENHWRFNRGHYSGGYVERYALLREQMGYDDPQGQTRLYE